MRRSLRHIDRIYTPEQVYELIIQAPYLYSYPDAIKEARDRALCSTTFLTCGRITEALSVRKVQVDLTVEKEFVIIRNMLVVKRRNQLPLIPLREEIPIPRNHDLKGLIKLLTDYLNLINDADRLFPFTRQHAWGIITKMTGKWPHWLRAQGETYYGKLFGDPYMLMDFMQYANLSSAAPYVKKDWRDYRDRLLKHQPSK